MTRQFERALFIVAAVCFGYYALAVAEASLSERRARVQVERALATTAMPRGAPAGGTREAESHLVGLLEIPRLELSTPVVEGDDGRTLAGAAGHLPDTPRPWERGNSAIAAHRDGLFRPLANVRIGDDVVVHTPHGILNYKVRQTRVVRPTDLSVLQASAPQMLTLITCYPFDYVGLAPKRFVVHAERVDPP
jgi:sortase A